MDYGAPSDFVDMAAYTVAVLSQGGEVEPSIFGLHAERLWIAAVCVVAMEELVRPYGNEARSLEGTRICGRESLKRSGKLLHLFEVRENDSINKKS